MGFVFIQFFKFMFGGAGISIKPLGLRLFAQGLRDQYVLDLGNYSMLQGLAGRKYTFS